MLIIDCQALVACVSGCRLAPWGRCLGGNAFLVCWPRFYRYWMTRLVILRCLDENNQECILKLFIQQPAEVPFLFLLLRVGISVPILQLQSMTNSGGRKFNFANRRIFGYLSQVPDSTYILAQNT